MSNGTQIQLAQSMEEKRNIKTITMYCTFNRRIYLQHGSNHARGTQFGVAQSDWQYHAYNGTRLDKVKPFNGLRAVFSAHPEPFQIITRKGSKIKDWNSLKGKSEYWKPRIRSKRNF